MLAKPGRVAMIYACIDRSLESKLIRFEYRMWQERATLNVIGSPRRVGAKYRRFCKFQSEKALTYILKSKACITTPGSDRLEGSV